MAVITNTTVTTDVAPAISIDLVNNLEKNISSLMELLGVTDLEPIAEGNTIKVYSTTVGTIPQQVAEGDEIPLTKVTLAEGTPIVMSLKKYRKLVTAESIQKVGREKAIYDTDRALIGAVRGDIKSDFFTALATGTGTATAGSNLQTQLANNWGAMQVFYKDYGDVRPVHFVNPLDVKWHIATVTDAEHGILHDAAVFCRTVNGVEYHAIAHAYIAAAVLFQQRIYAFEHGVVVELVVDAKIIFQSYLFFRFILNAQSGTWKPASLGHFSGRQRCRASMRNARRRGL